MKSTIEEAVERESPVRVSSYTDTEAKAEENAQEKKQFQESQLKNQRLTSPQQMESEVLRFNSIQQVTRLGAESR